MVDFTLFDSFISRVLHLRSVNKLGRSLVEFHPLETPLFDYDAITAFGAEAPEPLAPLLRLCSRLRLYVYVDDDGRRPPGSSFKIT